MDEMQKNSNSTAQAEFVFKRLNHEQASRISQDMVQDARNKVASKNFDTLLLLSEKYFHCKDKSSYIQ